MKEVTEKSERIAQLEQEKSALIKQLFEARARSAQDTSTMDSTFIWKRHNIPMLPLGVNHNVDISALVWMTEAVLAHPCLPNWRTFCHDALDCNLWPLHPRNQIMHYWIWTLQVTYGFTLERLLRTYTAWHSYP